MQFLQVPSAVNQFGGEVVEEFGVRGQFAADAKILRGPNDSESESTAARFD